MLTIVQTEQHLSRSQIDEDRSQASQNVLVRRRTADLDFSRRLTQCAGQAPI